MLKKNINIDYLQGYSILNNINPKHYQTKYPYSHHDAKNITFTENVIEILVKYEEKIKKGGEHQDNTSKKGSIIIYA